MALGEVRSVEPAIGLVETNVFAAAELMANTVNAIATSAADTFRITPPIRSNTLTSLDSGTSPAADKRRVRVPTYQYACSQCGHQFEAFQSFSDHPLSECPQCKGAVKKVFGAVGVVFKGTGFYKTDSKPAPKSE